MTEEHAAEVGTNFQEWEDRHTSQFDILMDPEFQGFGSAAIGKVIQEAYVAIDKYCPQWRPQDDSRFVVLNTKAEQGSYIGKWNGKHNILFTCSGEGELKDFQKRVSLRLAVIHELYHQKVAEVLGVDDPNGLDIERKLKSKVVRGMTDFQVAETLACTGADASLLQKVINEGCAVSMELEFFETMLGDEGLPEEERRMVTNFRDIRKGELAGKQDKWDTYSVGYGLVTRLQSMYRKDPVEVLKVVDWNRCGEITSETPLYNQILDNPQLIPGMESLS